MSGILGLLNGDVNDDTFVNTVGQSVSFEAANQHLQMRSDEMMKAYSVFIQAETEEYKERFKLPGGGYLEERSPKSENVAVRAYGEWDVAYPLKDFGAQWAGSDVEVAYMTMAHLQNHINTIENKAINTLRREILKRLFKDTTDTFTDRRKGALTIQPLANGDSVTYPPVLGSDTDATEDHYAETGYLTASISDTNNPCVTARNDLEEHFGTPTGYGNVVSFFNTTAVAYIEDLTDFVPVEDVHVRSGNDSNVPVGLPNVPGRIFGRSNGVWCVEWRWIPDTYMLSLDLEQPAPLKMRVDEAASGLGRGLQMVATENLYPMEHHHYRFRFGVGVANRLNGVVLEMATDADDYTIPTIYQ